MDVEKLVIRMKADASAYIKSLEDVTKRVEQFERLDLDFCPAPIIVYVEPVE